MSGVTYEVKDAPDERTAWRWANAEHFKAIKAEGVTKSAPPMFTPSGEKPPTFSTPKQMLGHPAVRAARGITGVDLVLGATQLGANVIGQGEGINRVVADLDKATQEAREEVGSTGVDWWNLAGSAASLPVTAAARIPASATTTGRAVQGAAIGGAAGAASPVADPDYWATKGIQVGTGILAGGAAPGAWEGIKAGGRTVRNVTQPYMGKWGADRAGGRLGNLAAGDKADAVIQAMINARTHVPGSNPTAGQAASPVNSAEFSALQKAVADRAPSTYYGPGGIEGQQNAARLEAVRTVGQTPADLNAAKGSRAASAASNYGAVAADVVVPNDPTITAILARPSMEKAMKRAEELAKERGGTFPGATGGGLTVENAQAIKMALDDLTKNPERFGIGASDVKAINETRAEYIKWLSQKSPGWEHARTRYAADSVPINQMQVGQELEKRLVPAISDEAKQRTTVFSNAMREAPQTIKKATTGQSRFDEMGQIMTPAQMASLTGVQSDLARDAVTTALASKGASQANRVIGTAVPEMTPTGMFSPKVSFARAMYNRLTGKTTDKILGHLATVMHDPPRMAKLMQDATPFERRKIVDALMRMQAVPAQNASMQGQEQF